MSFLWGPAAWNPKARPAPNFTILLLGHAQKCDFWGLRLTLLSAIKIWFLRKVEEAEGVGGAGEQSASPAGSTAAFPSCQWYFYSHLITAPINEVYISSFHSCFIGRLRSRVAGGTSTHQQPSEGCHLLPVSHLRCHSTILHHGGRMMYSFSFLFALLSELKTQVKEQGYESEERQNRGSKVPGRSVKQKQLWNQHSSVWTQYLRIQKKIVFCTYRRGINTVFQKKSR